MRKIDNDININEIPKHKKKRQSSTSKSINKTKHKHDYSGKCITKWPPYIYGGESFYYLTTYCIICGKIYDSIKPIIEENVTKKDGTEKTITRFMSNNELLENYSHLEVIEMTDSFPRYVPIVTKVEE